MAKNSMDAYGAIGKSNVLYFDPDDLTIITDPNHALFDRRALLPFDEPMVRNIMVEGIHQSITITKDVETGVTIVVDGRRRVINAREANRRLRDAGREPLRVPALVKRDGIAVLTSAMVSTNEIRRADSPINRAEKMFRMRQQGKTNEEIGISFGLEPSSIDAQMRLLDCCDDVRSALERDEITVTHALRLARLPVEQQRVKVAEVAAAGAGLPAHKRAAAQRDVLRNGPRMKSKREIQRLLEESVGDVADTLRWVLGMNGDTETPAADPRQMTIGES